MPELRYVRLVRVAGTGDTIPGGVSPVERIQESKLRALVSLLTDGNPRVVAESRRAITTYGSSVLPFLDEAMGSVDARLRVRARLAREDIRIDRLAREMLALRPELDHDPEKFELACILLAQSRDPEVDASGVRAALDAMGDDLATRIEDFKSPVAVARTMSQFLGRELGFRGNQRNYYDPRNSYLTDVLERRVGIPISLSAVYLFVAARLGVHLQGIGMPGHFILRFAGLNPPLFVDPFHGGRLLNEVDCRRFLDEKNFAYQSQDFEPMTHTDILLRMIGNLQLIYRNGSEGHRLRVLASLKNVLQVDVAPTESPNS